MINKSEIIEKYLKLPKAKRNRYYKKPFLMAWGRYFNYNELQRIDMLEPYFALTSSGMVKSVNDWNKLVIEYTEDNVKKTMCIAMDNAFKALTSNDLVSLAIYADDIRKWLDILEDNDSSLQLNYKKQNVDYIKFIVDVATKYHYRIPDHYQTSLDMSQK